MRRVVWGLVLVGLLGLLGCEALNPPAPTPILVSATPGQQFLIVTNTPTPSASPVLAPTLPGQEDVGDAATPTPPASGAPSSPTPDITATRTFTPTPTNTPATPGARLGPVGGAIAVEDVADCPTAPGAPFGAIFSDNPDLAAQIGCPLGNSARTANAFQPYEGGAMVWVASLGDLGQASIYAIYDNGAYQRFNDTWIDGVDPVSVGGDVPPGRVEPIRGFGKVWRESPGVGNTLGWATAPEAGGTAQVQRFERGEMLYVPQNDQTYILVSGQPGVWRSLASNF